MYGRNDFPKGDVFWTCFKIRGYAPNELHCTHKFLGNLNKSELKMVFLLIAMQFKHQPFIPFVRLFDQVEYFGDDKDVRVLLPKTNDVSRYYPKLRAKLNKFERDRYKAYKPHITTQLEKVNAYFDGYALCKNDRILASWTEKKSGN